jgi:UDP-N-acetylglucosamine acyltransferase
MVNVHPTAIVDPNAKIGKEVKIGAYSIIGANVELEDRVNIMSHVCIDGHTKIGEDTTIYPFSVIGYAPPDLKYKGEESRLVIGKNCTLREHVTIHTGTADDRMETTIGDNCLLMANAHVAHDCVLGNNVIMANCAALGGHVEVGDFAIIGGLAAVHQKVKIGAYSIIGGMSGVVGDVIPFGNVSGERASLIGLNVIGLKRRNIENKQIIDMNKAYDDIFLKGSDLFANRLAEVENVYKDDEYIMKIVDFIKSSGNRLCKPNKEKESNAA